MTQPETIVERLTRPCERDPFTHRWREEYYGWRCEFCGQFIAFGCEPWMPDSDGTVRR